MNDFKTSQFEIVVSRLHVLYTTTSTTSFANPKARRPGPTQLLTIHVGHQIKTLGSCQLYVHHNGNINKATFTVTDAPGPPLHDSHHIRLYEARTKT